MNPALRGRRIGLLTAWASRAGGGVFEAVVAQAQLIRELGAEPVVIALADEAAAVDASRFDGAEVWLSAVRGPKLIGYAPGLADDLSAANLDLLHLHGIWMYPSRAATLWARRTGRPYLISPHGMLDPWITGRGRWKKALARAGYERASWRAAAGFHALTEAEAGDIARESGRQDSFIIANPAPEVRSISCPAGRDLVYIGRIHAKKNIVALVEGWNRAKRPQSARLRIAGWGDDADIAALRAATAAGDGSAEFLGPVFGEDKAQLLAEARFVVLPSLSEGLPMAVLEAWAAGRPTLMTRDCNLPQGFAAGAALECGHSPQELARAIEQALALGEPEWEAMAAAARGLAEGPFAAQTIAAQWAKAYASAIEGTDGRNATA